MSGPDYVRAREALASLFDADCTVWAAMIRDGDCIDISSDDAIAAMLAFVGQRPELMRLAIEIERKTDRIHPSNRSSSLPVTLKVSRTLGEFQALVGDLIGCRGRCPSCDGTGDPKP